MNLLRKNTNVWLAGSMGRNPINLLNNLLNQEMAVIVLAIITLLIGQAPSWSMDLPDECELMMIQKANMRQNQNKYDANNNDQKEEEACNEGATESNGATSGKKAEATAEQ